MEDNANKVNYEPKRPTRFGVFLTKLKKLLFTSEDFANEASVYTKADAKKTFIVLTVFWLILSGFITAPSINYQSSQSVLGLYWGQAVIFVIGVASTLAFFLVLGKRNNGMPFMFYFRKKNIVKSILMGAILSIPSVFINLNLGSGSITLQNTTESYILLLLRIAFAAIYIPLVEEMIFRAYLSPRFYGSFKNKILSIILVGLLFGAHHYVPLLAIVMGATPASPQLNIVEVIISSIGYFIFMHVLLFWNFVRFNNIWGPVFFHFCINLSSLFYG